MRLRFLVVVAAVLARGASAHEVNKDPMNLPGVREAAERARARLGLATAREVLDLVLAERRRLSSAASGSGAKQQTSLSMVAPAGGEATISFRKAGGQEKEAEIKLNAAGALQVTHGALSHPVIEVSRTTASLKLKGDAINMTGALMLDGTTGGSVQEQLKQIREMQDQLKKDQDQLKKDLGTLNQTTARELQSIKQALGWVQVASFDGTKAIVASDYDAVCAPYNGWSGNFVFKVQMGTYTDYYRGTAASLTFCDVVKSHTKHQWSSSGTGEWRVPQHYYYAHLGGSAAGWPRDYVDGDNRRYISFWGSGGSTKGGCCSPGDKWELAFTMSIKYVVR